MNTSVLIKEGRPLFWPWCAIMLTGLVSLIRPLHSIEWVGLLGLVVGVPLLATLPFGNEFQNRTLSLLLSQPVGRVRIWAEKSCIAFVAVASVVFIFAFSPLIGETVPDRGQQAYAVALIIAVLASATFWTLVARSTIGDVALSVGTVLVIVALVSVATGFGGNSLFVTLHSTAIRVATLLCYAGVMFWFGERTLARYQVTGTMAGDDLLSASSDASLGVFSSRARSNPKRPVLNLISKELRLLRPVWLITVLTAATWTCLAFGDLARQQKAPKTLSLPIMAFGFASAAIIAILAGCLSLGEEKTSGTYTWHRTLPISAARQWSVKLSVALFVSLVCAGAIPVLLLSAGEHLFPSAFSRTPAHFPSFWLLGALFLTLFSFWCACAVNGTVTAVVWVAPFLTAVVLTPQMASWAGLHFAEFLAFKSRIFADFRFTAFVLSLGRNPDRGGVNPPATALQSLILWAPAAILTVIQSYRMFRAPIRESAVSVGRRLVPLLAVGLLCNFFAYSIGQISNFAIAPVAGAIFSADGAIQRALSNSANREAPQPLQLNSSDFKKEYTFRGAASRWLNGASATVVLDKAHPTTCCAGAWYSGGRFLARQLWNYTATVHLASGAELILSFEPPAENPAGPPRRRASVLWPGKTVPEPLFP